MTEEERYAAKGTFINGNIKKGEVKQESWMEMIKSIIENETNVKSSIRNLLNSISTYNNVPRKQVKFVVCKFVLLPCIFFTYQFLEFH